MIDRSFQQKKAKKAILGVRQLDKCIKFDGRTLHDVRHSAFNHVEYYHRY
jgi:hypothetical protein